MKTESLSYHKLPQDFLRSIYFNPISWKIYISILTQPLAVMKPVDPFNFASVPVYSKEFASLQDLIFLMSLELEVNWWTGKKKKQQQTLPFCLVLCDKTTTTHTCTLATYNGVSGQDWKLHVQWFKQAWPSIKLVSI